ncbi:MAG: hypothetical protein OEZ34_16675 [Spirochaetia bacterium]|nr:hypothetical protein [Spirochaetia bacterium]
MDSTSSENIIYYSLADLPDDSIQGETLDLQIQWETSLNLDAGIHESSIRNAELNELLEHKIRAILKEKSGCCIHIKKERIQHSINYAHGSHVVIAEYNFIIYKKKNS